MKLYVWDDVFCDWTCGMAFAVASSKEEAIKIIANGQAPYREELQAIEPSVYKVEGRKTPIGFYSAGGG